MNNIRMFVFFMGVVLSLGAQNDPSKDFIAKALTVYPVSPEAASLGKYGDLPINLASGKINYTVPLYTISIGDFNWPILLSYNHSGLKTEETPGVCGLGWDLLAGGRISREVRGVADERINAIFFKQSLTPYLNYRFDEQRNKKTTTPSDLKKLLLYKDMTENKTYDGHPDVYHLKAGGLQGSYMINHLGKVVFPIHKNYWVDHNNKTIMDNQGVQYFFEVNESTLTNNTSQLSSWLLTKIVTPNNKGSIHFEYYPIDIFKKYRKVVRSETKIEGPVDGDHLFDYHQSSIAQQHLKKIIFPNGSIHFLYSDFEIDLATSAASTQKSAGKTLTQVQLYDASNNLLNSYVLNYDNEARFNKLLKTIKRTQGSTTLPLYAFDYYAESLLKDNYDYTAQDIWGYYNGKTASNGIIENSNREINFNNTLIGALKKVYYPTGGTTEITYEQNEVEATENHVVTCSPKFDTSEDGTYSIKRNTTKKIDTIIDLKRKQVARVYVKLRFTPNQSATNAAKRVSVKLNFMDENRFAKLSCGTKSLVFPIERTQADLNLSEAVVELELNKTGYLATGKLIIEGVITTEEIGVEIDYSVDYEKVNKKVNKKVGGLRVASTKTEVPLSETILTQYKYVTTDGVTSSGKVLLTHNPSFLFEVEKIFDHPDQSHQSGIYKYQYARSKNSLISYADNSVLYDRVEIHKDDGTRGKTVNHYSTAYTSNSPFPYRPTESNDFQKGLLLKQEIFERKNNRDELVKSIQNEYEKVYPYADSLNKRVQGLAVGRMNYAYSTANVLVSYISDFEAESYFIYPKAMRLKETTITTYHLSGNQIEKTTHIYDQPQNQKIEIQVAAADGRTIIEKYQYPYAPHVLGQVNRISQPIKKQVYLKSPSGAIPKLLRTQHTTHTKMGSAVVPHKLQTAKGAEALEDRLIFDRYDAYGNPLEQHPSAPNAPHTVTLWGHAGQYPIAQIQNATFAQVQQALGLSGNQTPNETHLNAINALRNTKTQWLITTYEHFPLVGVKSITLPNGTTTHFEYDAFNRLKNTKDQDQKLLAAYRYHYANEN